MPTYSQMEQRPSFVSEGVSSGGDLEIGEQYKLVQISANSANSANSAK